MSAELSNVSSYSALTELHQLPFGVAESRWYSGYHGFKPELTNKLAFSCQLNCSSSPAVRSRTGDPVTRCEPLPGRSTKTSLFSTVTVPPVPRIWAYFCGHIGSFKQVSSHRIAPVPPRCRRQPLAQITWLRHGCRSSASRIRDERLKR